MKPLQKTNLGVARRLYGEGWSRLTRITNYELQILRLSFSRSENSEETPLILCLIISIERRKMRQIRKTSFSPPEKPSGQRGKLPKLATPLLLLRAKV